jgi:predicted ATPase
LIAAGSTTRRPLRQLSTLIGRDWELSGVKAMLDQVIKGRGRIVGLVGPPGIGKSRMTAEIASAAADRSCQVFMTHCESHAKEIPFHAAAGLLRDVFAITGLDAVAARAAVHGRMPAADPEDLLLLDDFLGIHDPEISLSTIEPAARGRRLAALLNAAAMNRSTPALYIVEDVHWIDSVSETMIAQFAAVIPQTHAMLLITHRPEYAGVLNQLPSAHRIALAPLDDSESVQLAVELCGSDSSVSSLIAQVAARAAGNPFFAEEMIRDLAERGVLEGELGDYVFCGDTAEVSVPASLQATIAARIDRLRPAAKRTLAAASVIGSQFDTALVGCLVDDIDVAELTAAELIDQVSFVANSEYMFRHPLIRTVAYEAQLRADRAQLHRQLAAAVEARDPETPDPSAALIAQHLEAAGDLRAAFDWHMRAGAWAQFRDFRAARSSWQQAREVADRLRPDDPE